MLRAGPQRAVSGTRTPLPRLWRGHCSGAVRATDWSLIDQSSLRSVAVQIHAAQDWLVLSAEQPHLFDAVSTATYGLLSLNRRARLLLALHSRDWETVWSAVSATDLFFLAGRLREQHLHAPGADPGMRSPPLTNTQPPRLESRSAWMPWAQRCNISGDGRPQVWWNCLRTNKSQWKPTRFFSPNESRNSRSIWSGCLRGRRFLPLPYPP